MHLQPRLYADLRQARLHLPRHTAGEHADLARVQYRHNVRYAQVTHDKNIFSVLNINIRQYHHQHRRHRTEDAEVTVDLPPASVLILQPPEHRAITEHNNCILSLASDIIRMFCNINIFILFASIIIPLQIESEC